MSPKVFEVLPSGGDGAGGKTLRRAVIGLVLFVVLILGAPVTVVPAGHVGVKDFFGRVSANALPAGVHLVFPFTRLVHAWSAPVWYLGRKGYQIVRTRRSLPQTAAQPAQPAE